MFDSVWLGVRHKPQRLHVALPLSARPTGLSQIFSIELNPNGILNAVRIQVSCGLPLVRIIDCIHENPAQLC